MERMEIKMFRGKVKVDRFLQERVQYESPEFPIISRADVFDEFIDGEFSCHWHEDIEFTIVVQGEVEFRIHQASKEQQIKILKAGDGAFINAKTMHSARQVVPESIAYYFVIPARIFQMQASDLIYRKYVLPVIERPVAGLYLEKENPADWELLDVLGRFFRVRESEEWELEIMENLCAVWRSLWKRLNQVKEEGSPSLARKRQEYRVRKMLEYIHENFGRNISVEDMAEVIHVSKSECFRSLQNIVGKAPAEYLIQYRLTQASRMLAETDMSIAEVGMAAGFQSPSYFGKMFRDRQGISPGKYRKLHRQREGYPQ